MKKQVMVVDANVFVSALLKDSATRKLMLAEDKFELHSPDFIEEELSKYFGSVNFSVNIFFASLQTCLFCRNFKGYSKKPIQSQES